MKVPLFQNTLKRAAGVLLHISSLPNDLLIGNFGKSAYVFLDFLEASGLHYWQVCPLGPTGFGDSPYQCFSSFALNPYFIDLEVFLPDILTGKDLAEYRTHTPHSVHYDKVYAQFWPLIKKAFYKWSQTKKSYPEAISFDEFVQLHQKWLYPYASFMVFKEVLDSKPLEHWPSELKPYSEKLGQMANDKYPDLFNLHCFIQYTAYSQWDSLKKYAHGKKVQIIGDIPIFVAADSADLWCNPEIFFLSESLSPALLAGVPPDYFSPTGQLWGNPLYNWDLLKRDNYNWWIDRLRAAQAVFDVIRLDHFRGFDEYWAVPACAKNASLGSWNKGPGLDFFKAIYDRLGNIQMIAEDLGIITDSVRALLKDTGLAGMAVQQFGFGGRSDNTHLSHNFLKNQIVYTATHDNDTAWGWYNKALPATQKHVCQYLNVNGSAIPWDFIRNAYQSVCQLAIVSMQDFLSLGSEARLNTPSTPSNNWIWRCTHTQLQSLWRESAGYLHYLGSIYNRI